jgi:hypothetical protein
MTTQSNVCACGTCVAVQCTCGCQNRASLSAASCQCGDVCTCGPTCTCKACQHENAPGAESR